MRNRTLPPRDNVMPALLPDNEDDDDMPALGSEDNEENDQFVACFTTREKPVDSSAEKLKFLVDNASNVHLICDPLLQSSMYDLSPSPPKPQFILMNSFPARIVCRGSLDLQVLCSRTGAAHVLQLKNVAFCAESSWNILSWSALADQLQGEPLLLTGRTEVGVPTASGGRVWGKRTGGLYCLQLTSADRESVQVVEGGDEAAGDQQDLRWGGGKGAQIGAQSGGSTDFSSESTDFSSGSTDFSSESTDFSSKSAESGGGDMGASSGAQRSLPLANLDKEGVNTIRSKSSDLLPEGVDKASHQIRSEEYKEGARILATAIDIARTIHDSTNHGASMSSMQTMVRRGDVAIKEAAVRRVFLTLTHTLLRCKYCALAAQDKKHTADKPRHSTEGEEGRWTVDLSGKKWPASVFGRFCYFAVWVAPNNKGVFVTFHNGKTGILNVLRGKRKQWERETGEKMLILGCDRGGENKNKFVREYCEENGIKLDFTTPGGSAGASETMIGVLQERMQASLARAGLPPTFWAEALAGCVRALDFLPCAPLGGMSRYEHRTGRKPQLHTLFPVGAWTSAYVAASERLKGTDRGRECLMLGPEEDDMHGFRLLTLDLRSLISSASVTVYADVFPRRGDTLASSDRDPFTFSAEQAFEHPQPVGASAVGLVGAKEKANLRQPAAELQFQPHPDPEPQFEVEVEPDPPAEQLGARVRAQPARYSEADYQAAVQHDKERALVTGERLVHSLSAGETPMNHVEAENAVECAGWGASEDAEMEGLLKNGTFMKVKKDSAEAQAARRNGTIPSKPVYARKQLPVDSTEEGPSYMVELDGTKIRFKCRIVCKGFMQRAGSFGEVYAATPSEITNRMMFSHSLFKKWKSLSRDVSQAFVIPDLPRAEYVVFVSPRGFEEKFKTLFNLKDDDVLILVKPLYGLKQASARFSEKRDGVLTGPLGYEPVRADPSFFIHRDKDGNVDSLCAPHVDDVPMAGEAAIVDKLMARFAKELPTTGEDGEIRAHLKVDISKSADGRTMEYSQPLYAQQILKEAGMTGCNPRDTPSAEGVFLTKPTEPITPEEVEEMKGFDYPRIASMLGWLMMISRPDLAESVGVAKGHLQDYRPAHVLYVKDILKYLAGTLDYGLRYTLDPITGQPDAGELKVFVDSSFGGEQDRPSKSGGVAIYNGAAVAWWSRKQGRTARSSTDSEIIALDEGARRALWLRQMAMAMGIEGGETIEVLEDNAQAEGFANDTKVPKRTRYMRIRLHAVRDDVKFGDIKVSKVASRDNMSDALTKPLQRVLFCRFRDLMGVVPCKLHARQM
jgi:hypothetical protein